MARARGPSAGARRHFRRYDDESKRSARQELTIRGLIAAISDGRLNAAMYRLDDAEASEPHFTLKDSFILSGTTVEHETRH